MDESIKKVNLTQGRFLGDETKDISQWLSLLQDRHVDTTSYEDLLLKPSLDTCMIVIYVLVFDPPPTKYNDLSQSKAQSIMNNLAHYRHVVEKLMDVLDRVKTTPIDNTARLNIYKKFDDFYTA